MGSSDLEPQALRRLLSQLLRSDPDFEAFCLDHFPDVYRRFSLGMERTQKENLLLVHVPSRAELIAALRKSFPDHLAWSGLERARTPREKRQLPLLVIGGLAAALLMLFVGRAVLRSNSQGASTESGSRAIAISACGALHVDDVFVVKTGSSPLAAQLLLDVRLRHGGSSAAPVNLTRAVVLCGDRTPERSPYKPSASYDLLISGAQNEAAIAQRLMPGEVDRVLLRLGFTPESAAYQYTARLKLLYNGSCMVESAPFVLSRDAARWSAQVAP